MLESVVKALLKDSAVATNVGCLQCGGSSETVAFNDFNHYFYAAPRYAVRHVNLTPASNCSDLKCAKHVVSCVAT